MWVIAPSWARFHPDRVRGGIEMKKQKVTAYNVDECSNGTLITAFRKLDKVDASDAQKAVQAAELQAKISLELENRGWVYDEEEEDDWVYYL